MDREDVRIGAPPVHEGEIVEALAGEIFRRRQRHRDDLEIEPNRLQHALDRFEHRDGDIVALHIDDELSGLAVFAPQTVSADRPPRFVQELSGHGGIVAIQLLNSGIVAPVGRLQRTPGDGRDTGGRDPGDHVLVHGELQRLGDRQVIRRRELPIDQEHRRGAGEHVLEDLKLRIGPHALDVEARHLEHVVDFAVLKGGEPGLVLRDEFHDQGFEVGGTVVLGEPGGVHVVLVAGHGDLVAAHPLLEDVRPGPDRALGEVLTELLHGRR